MMWSQAGDEMGEPREFEARGAVGSGRRGPLVSVVVVAAVALGLVAVAVGGRLTTPPPTRSTAPSASPALTSPRPPTAFAPGAELTATGEIMFVGGGLIPSGAHLVVLGAGVARGVPAYQVESVAFINHRANRGPAEAGWVAAQLLAPNVEPTVVVCPNAGLDPANLARLTGHERLGCVGGGNVTVGPGLLRVQDALVDARQLWLTADNVAGMPVYGTDAKTLDPGLLDRWVFVSGRFDDPIGAGCAGQVRAECRERFVVTSISRTSPPDGMIAGSWTVDDSGFPLPPDASFTVTDHGLFAWGGERDATGGRDGSPGALFDVAMAAWRPIAAAPIPRRDSPVLAWTRGHVILIGGIGNGTRGGDGGARRDAAAYDPASNRWRRIADAPFAVGAAASVLAAPGRIVVAENVNVATTGRHRVALYDVDHDRWSTLPELPLETDDSAQLVAVGGRPVLVRASRSGSNADMFALDRDGGTWRVTSDAPAALGPLVAIGDRLVGLVVDRTDERRTRTSVGAWDPATGAWSTVVSEDDFWFAYGTVADGDHLVVAGMPWRYVDVARGNVTPLVPPPAGVELGRAFGVVGRQLVGIGDDAVGRPIAVTFRPDNPSAFGGEPR
jgi:hypothetical protein